jgi:hypothetical protein
MQAPAVLILLGVEAAPRVQLCCENDSEEARLRHWINSRPGLAELLEQACELAERAA